MKQEKEQCHWAEDEHGNWFSGCDHAFTVDYGSPHDNDMMFCPFCGGRLIEHKYNFTTSSDVAETPPVAQSPATNEPFRVLNTLGAAGGDYSDTPETDEFERATCYGNQSSLDFARKLERERNEARDLCRWAAPRLRAICHDFDVSDTGWACAKQMESHPEIFPPNEKTEDKP